MSDAPKYEPRREAAFEAELLARARAWLPEWQPRTARGDFLAAVFKIAARFSSEVAQRLDRIPEKNFRGFLHWLGIRGSAGRAARVPVVLRMTPGAQAVQADPPVRFQALGTDPPVVFETTSSFTVTPAALVSMIGADVANDFYAQTASDVLSLDPPNELPSQWIVVSDAPAGSRVLQLDPGVGLDAGVLIQSEEETAGQYTIVKPDPVLVGIEPPVGTSADGLPGTTGIKAGTSMKRVRNFEPFGEHTRNAQEHVVYIGAKSVLDIESRAYIVVGNATGLAAAEWSYWGKVSESDDPDWIPLKALVKQAGLVLLKDEGTVEEKEIGGHRSRWLRAWRNSLGTHTEIVSLDEVTLQVNCGLEDDEDISSFMNAGQPAPLTLEGVANTTPLVLNTPFYPLGREPRLFDAFYLGSKEAFSKANALVTLDFTMANEWATPAAGLTSAGGVQAILALDLGGALRIARIETVAGERSVTWPAPTQPLDAEGKAVELDPKAGIGIAVRGNVMHAVAFASNGECWCWTARARAGAPDDLGGGVWKSLGMPPEKEPGARAACIRTTAVNTLEACAVVNKRVYSRDISALGPWRVLDATAPSGDGIEFASVAPFSTGAAGTPQGWLVGITAAGSLYFFDTAQWRPGPLLPRALDPTSRPTAVWSDANTLRVWSTSHVTAAGSNGEATSTGKLIAVEIQIQNNSFDPDPTVREVDLEVLDNAVALVDLARVAFVAVHGGTRRPGVWQAFGAVDEEPAFLTDLPAGIEGAARAPTVVGNVIAVPATKAHLWLADLDAAAHLAAANEVVHNAFLVASDLVPGEPLIVEYQSSDDATPQRRRLSDLVKLANGQTALVLPTRSASASGADEIRIFREQGDAIPVTRESDTTVRISKDDAPEEGTRVAMKWQTRGSRRSRLYLSAVTNVSDVDPDTDTRVLTLDRSIPAGARNVTLTALDQLAQAPAVVRPAVQVELEIAQIRRGSFAFPDLEPRIQKALPEAAAASAGPGAALHWAILSQPWRIGHEPDDDGVVAMAFDATFGDFQEYFAPLPRNPALSWEYWDGSAWWQIDKEDMTDTTAELLTSGRVRFCVPPNIASTDVAGHTNFWVRARLVGGDYGQETVKIDTQPGPTANSSTQIVTRSTENIRAPYVVSLEASYTLCCPAAPDAVLTSDSGGLVDQTAANLDKNTPVKAFVHLTHSIQSAAPSGRGIYLGFSEPISGTPVSLLFLVRESAYDGAFPLRVEALRAGGFEPVVSQDRTRGLNETGTITIDLAQPPIQARLFGRALYWIRLLPRLGSDESRWNPNILGAYVNGTWANATETQTLEILGSTDGRPGLVANLARVPVVAGSLRLRVRESLSEEQIAELRATSPEGDAVVRDDIEQRPGTWVLWKEVPDLLESGPDDRVYTLDDETGAITFGDGLHGRIPPVGRDSILAERYQRGGGAAANAVKAFSEASLVTPLAGVSGVVLPDSAAGGSDPEDAQRTLRFAPSKLRQRGRALTLADLEASALELSPDIVQSFARQTRRAVEVFVVMRGPAPRPSESVRRELTRWLRTQVSPQLAMEGALVVRAPDIVPIAISIKVLVSDLDDFGPVASQCKKRVLQLLDAEKGGLDQLGWPLGRWPEEAEISACLDGVEALEEVESVTVARADSQPVGVQAHELVWLAEDDITITPVISSSLVEAA